MKRETVEYIVGDDLPDLDCWILSNGSLVDLSSGWTFALTVVASSGAAAFTKTDNILGDVGVGTAQRGSPNLIVQWDTSGDLNGLASGTYLAELKLTRVADSKQTRRQFYLSIVQGLAA